MSNKYNNSFNVSKNLSKYNKIKKAKEDYNNETAAEKLAYVYSGKHIDIRDSGGILLMNSGMNFRTNKLTKTENKDFTDVVEDIYNRGVFEAIANKSNTAKQMTLNAIDYNNKIAFSMNQKTKTFSSIHDIKMVYDNFKDLRQRDGDLFIFDTETIGGKSRSGIWNPLGITEFAMQEVNLGTNDYTSTNIVMGIAPTKQNRDIKEKIIKLMEAGDWQAIEQNEELFVTAKRVGLYATADIDYSGPYAKISKLPSAENVPWKNVDTFKEGWSNLEKAYKTSKMTNNGLRASDEEFLGSIVRLQTALNNRTGMAMGQNFQIFDEKVINNQLRQMQYTYEQIALGTDAGIVLSNYTGIKQGQAQTALKHINTQLGQIGGGLNMPNDLTFDTLPFFAVARDNFGVDPLYNYNQKMIKQAKGGTAKQEYIGEAWFPELFEGNNAHMADFDVTVLRYLATQNPEGMNETVMDHIMNSMGVATGKKKMQKNKGIYGLADANKNLTEGQIFYAKGSGDKKFQGKTLLNFTYNEKTGEVFTNSGYNFVNGKSMGFSKNDINMGTNLKRGQFYRVEQIKKVKAEDISKQLGLVNPDMSGTEFFHVQFKMQLPTTQKNSDLQYITYNYLFNSEKELGGFLSSELKMALEKDDKGVYHVVQGAEDLFDWKVKDQDGKLTTLAHLKGGMTEAESINEALIRSHDEFIAEKAYNSILDSDKSHKKVQQMLDAEKFLNKKGLNNISSKELNNLIDNKKIRNLTEEQTKEISEKLNNIFGFYSKATKERVLYSNTQRNITNSWNTVIDQKTFFKTVLDELDVVAKNKKYNDEQKNFVFNELVEAFRVEAAGALDNSSDETVRKNVNNAMQHLTSAYEQKRYFDIKMPESFNKEKNHVIEVSSKLNPDRFKNVLRVDLDNSNASYKLVSDIRKMQFGDQEFFSDMDIHNRKAFTNFMKVMDKTYGDDDWFKNIHKIIKDSPDDYNVDVVSRKLIDFMNAKKRSNPTHAFIKEFDYRSLYKNTAMNDKLNEVTADQVKKMIKNNIVDPVDSKSLLKNKDGMKNFIKTDVMKHYMPSQEEFKKSLKGLTDDQIWQKTKLYDLLYEDISAQLEDILSMSTRIEGAETYISKTGDIIVNKGGKAVSVASMPRIKSNNGTLYGQLGRQEFMVHLDVDYDADGNAKIVTNLGEKFRANKKVSSNIRRKLKDGTFKLEDIYQYTNYLSKDFMEEATYSRTSGEALNNFFVGTKDFDTILPEIFRQDGAFNDLLDNLAVPENVKELMKDIPKEIKAGKLDPAKNQLIGAYRIPIMRALAKSKVEDHSEILKLFDLLNLSGKDKSKTGKDIYMGGGFRYHTGFTDTLDDNSRPVIGGSGNVFYMLTKNVKKAAEESIGTVYEGALFESAGTSYINRIQRDLTGDITTSFTGRTAYVNQIGIDKLINDFKTDILDKNKVNFKTGEQAEKVYDFLHSFLNTFEQAKVFDAELFDTVTGGSMSAQVQTLSGSKDIINAIEKADDPSIYDDLWNLRGSFSRDGNGKLRYTSDAGKIVKRGDAIVPYISYGDTSKNWVSKMHRGLLRYTVRDTEGLFLDDEKISSILTQYADRFDDIDIDDQKKMMSAVEDLFEELGFKAGYTIEDVNRTTLPKILVNNAEKSMNQLALMRLGTVDDRVAGVLRDYSDETAELIGKVVPTTQALKAYFKDQQKLESVLKKYQFKSLDDFIRQSFEESHVANKMIFGKGGLFEGFVAIGNDNIMGHKNKGTIMTGALDEAISMLGKWNSQELKEDAISRKLGLDKFVDMVNQNDDFKFFRNSETGEGYDLEVKDGHLRIKGGADLKEGFVDFDMVDMERAENLIREIDKEIVEEAKKRGLDPESLEVKKDRLVHIDKQIIDGETKDIEFVGRLFYGKDEALGSSGLGSLKIVIDSETQSGMDAQYKQTKVKLQELKERRKEMKAQILNVDPGLVPDDFLRDLGDLDMAIESLEKKLPDWEETGHYYRLSDRERNVLTQHTVREDLFNIMDKDVKSGLYSRDSIEINEALRGISKEDYKDKTVKVFDFIEKEAIERQYYSPLDEKLLTKDMIENDEQYAKYKKIYENITEKQGYKLGVDNAQDLYELQSIEAAKQFNNTGKVKLSELENDFGFEVITPEQYMARYGDVDMPSYDTLVKSNVVIDLGDEFADVDRFIAVPGTGAVVGDAEIKRPWHRSAGNLARTYQRDFLDAQGDEEARQKAVENLMKYKDQVAEDTTTFVKKKGQVHKRMQYELETPTIRNKIMTVTDTSPLLESAQVHGQSLAEWRRRGVYYDAVWHDIEQFEKAGFFSDEMKAKVGVSTDDEMIEYLQTHGAVMMSDRYPNIYDTSIGTTRHYLLTGDDLRATNAVYATQELALKLNADSDGDSLTTFLLAKGDTTHMEYEAKRFKAMNEADKMPFADDKAREAFIKTKTLSFGIDEDTYDKFRQVDVRESLVSYVQNQNWHDRVEETKADDAIKVKKAQTVYNSVDGRAAELPGGKSILGREKYTAMSYTPGLSEIDESIDRVDSLLQVVRDNADLLDNADGKYDLILKNNYSILDFDKENEIMDIALQGVEELVDQGHFGDGDVGKTYQNAMENIVRQRVRMNNYHNEIMSKLGIGAVGNVNAAFYGATQAAKIYYTERGSALYNPLDASILSVMATEIEQASISSKKAEIKAGDGRVVTLGNILNDIQRNGLGDPNQADSNYQLAMGWLDKNMDKKKVIKQYQNIAREIDLGDDLLDWSTDEGKEKIFKLMNERTIQTYNKIYRDDVTRQEALAYKLLGAGSARVDSFRVLTGMDTQSNAGRIVAAITNYTSTGPGPKAARSNTTSSTIGNTARQSIRTVMNTNQTSQYALNKVSRSMSNIASSGSSHSIGGSLGLAVVGLAAGLIAAGYAGGNPLNDANPENITEQPSTVQQAGPTFSTNPGMAPNNTGGYIINIKGDTKEGNRQLKKAMKQAAKASTGGSVNINMSLRTSQSGGYSDKDIENILNEYI